MGYNANPDPRLERPGGTVNVTGFRRVNEEEGLFMLPEDTAQSTWDLDPNVDGDLVIPDDIDGRAASEAPDVSGADVVSVLVVSQDSQDITISIDWLATANGSANNRTEGTSQSDLFGPDTRIRTNFFTVGKHMRLTISSNAGAGVQNRVGAAIETH